MDKAEEIEKILRKCSGLTDSKAMGVAPERVSMQEADVQRYSKEISKLFPDPPDEELREKIKKGIGLVLCGNCDTLDGCLDESGDMNLSCFDKSTTLRMVIACIPSFGDIRGQEREK